MECAEPQIAEEFMIGNTKVRIATDYCCEPRKYRKSLNA